MEPQITADNDGQQVVLAGTLVHRKPGDVVIARVLNPYAHSITIAKRQRLGDGEIVTLPDSNVFVCTAADSDPSEVVRQANTSPGNDDLFPPHLKDLYVRTCEDQSEEIKSLVHDLLFDFQDVFSKHDNDLGLTHLTEHVIDTGNAVPIRQPPRRVPSAYAGEDKAALDKLIEQGCIRPSSSPWASGVVLVRKKDGSVRHCVDYRGLNKLTRKDAFPLPRTEDCLDAVAGATVFSTFDITSAYNQVPVRPEDIPKTAFVTKYGLYEYTTMPFGLCNAPATFERLMEIAMNGLQWNTCLIYLDDLIVFSNDAGTHASRIRAVLERVRAAGLKLKPRKCSLFQSQVTFLGHVISSEGVLPNPDNVAKLAEWKVPESVTEVRSFLGLGNYYRRFVKDYSLLVKPLTDLTKKDQAFQWTAACQSAFESLKRALMGPDIMAYPTHDGYFILDCDACDVSIGAVLSQVQGGRERVVAYGSRTLNRHERNYCVTDRELLAVKHFVEHYKHHLLGRHFTVRSDHQALKWLFSLREPKQRIARWLEILSAYDFEIEYRPGVKHGNADALSRCPDLRSCTCTTDEPLPCGPCNKCKLRIESMAGTLPGGGEHTCRAVGRDYQRGHTSFCWTVLGYIMLWLCMIAWFFTGAEAFCTTGNSDCATVRQLRGWTLSYSFEQLAKKQQDDPR